MISKQLIVGNSTEERIAQFFSQKKYWAYILPKKLGGQPFDVIACRGNNTWFIDAKHLEANKASFSFERIEPNQRTSMKFAKIYADIKNLGFIIEWDRCPENLFYLSYDKLIEIEQNGAKSVKIEALEVFGNEL